VHVLSLVVTGLVPTTLSQGSRIFWNTISYMYKIRRQSVQSVNINNLVNMFTRYTQYSALESNLTTDTIDELTNSIFYVLLSYLEHVSANR